MLFNFLLETLAKTQINQTMTFDQEDKQFYCDLTFEPALDINAYSIYKNHKTNAPEKALPICSGTPKVVKSTGDSRTYRLAIPVGNSKVHQDGTKYSFKFLKDKEHCFTEPFGWHSGEKCFVYASEIPTPFYQTVTFIIIMCCLGAVIVGGAGFMLYKKSKNSAAPEDEDL